jgi:hypothetical protein
MLGKSAVFILLFSFISVFGCCTKPPVKEKAPAVQSSVKKYDESNYGSVVFVKLQGGFFGIVNDKGEKFVPEQLPDMFRSDGLRVFFDYQLLETSPNTPVWGKPIRLTVISIE